MKQCWQSMFALFIFLTAGFGLVLSNPGIPKIAYYPDIHCLEGSDATLVCYGENYEIINWRRGKLWLRSSSKYLQKGTGTLVIRNVQFEDAGVYICQAQNSLFASARKAVKLTIEENPNKTRKQTPGVKMTATNATLQSPNASKNKSLLAVFSIFAAIFALLSYIVAAKNKKISFYLQEASKKQKAEASKTRLKNDTKSTDKTNSEYMLKNVAPAVHICLSTVSPTQSVAPVRVCKASNQRLETRKEKCGTDNENSTFTESETVSIASESTEDSSENAIKKRSFEQSDFEYSEGDDFIIGGGFGEVYRAKLKATEEIIALKIFFRKRRSKSESRLLNKEASILISIKPHPNIVRLIGICDSARCYALLMEFVSGGDLAQLIASSDPAVQKWKNRLDIVGQIADGMAHLHNQSPSVIHLDLKPSNILIEKEGKELPFHCKICDFGHAKMKSVSSITEARPEGSLPSGTVAYIAPERYRPVTYGTDDSKEKREIAKKSDVFSFGVLLWEVRERQHPFRGMDPLAIHLRIKSGVKKFPDPTVESPKGYDNLLKKCTKFNPAGRPHFSKICTCLEDIKRRFHPESK